MVVGGKQLLADGDMEKEGTTDWLTQTGVTANKISGGATDGHQVLQITKSSVFGGGSGVYQNILNVGKAYLVSGWYKTSGTAEARISTVSTGFVLSPSVGEWTFFRQNILGSQVSATAFYLQGYGGSSGDEVYFDDIVVTQID